MISLTRIQLASLADLLKKMQEFENTRPDEGLRVDRLYLVDDDGDHCGTVNLSEDGWRWLGE